MDKCKPARRARRHKQRAQQHRDGAIQSVNLDFAIGPVVQRPPRSNVAVFHLVKDFLDDKLAPVGPDDLRIAPLLCGR